MTARITQRQVVLDRLTHLTDSPLDRSVTQVGFARTVDDDEPEYPELWIDLADFRALGEPEQITVTIEPGDRLNDDPEEFCPRCLAGTTSDEHHGKCVITGHAIDGEPTTEGAAS